MACGGTLRKSFERFRSVVKGCAVKAFRPTGTEEKIRVAQETGKPHRRRSEHRCSSRGKRKYPCRSRKNVAEGTAGCWSGKNDLSNLIQRLTGVKATSNVLRSSFVSMLMGDNPDDSLKASAAKLLNHGLRTQAEVYDRRSSTQKKQHAQSFVAKRDRDFCGPLTGRRSKTTVIDFSPGMIVVVPFKDNVTGDDAFWLAKVMSCDGGAELTLIELAPTNTPNEYRADLRSVWREPTTACYLCDVQYDERSNSYMLRTTLNEISGLLKD